MTGKVRIVCGPDAPHDCEVYLDDHRVSGLVHVHTDIGVAGLPVVTFAVEPEILEYEGPSEVAWVDVTKETEEGFVIHVPSWVDPARLRDVLASLNLEETWRAKYNARLLAATYAQSESG